MRDRGEFVPARKAATTREPGADFWKRAKPVMPESKKSVHLRVDTDVLEWFRAQGKGHLTRMNAVLRSYVAAQRSARR